MPKFGKAGGIGSATSTYPAGGGEPQGGTYSINGATGAATFNGTLTTNGAILNPRGSIAPNGFINFSALFPGTPTGVPADVYRFDVGGFPFSDEFSGISNTVSAVTGSINIPAGVGTGPYSSGVSGYAVTYEPNRPAQGGFFEGGMGVANSTVVGLNTEVMNCRNHSATYCGIGNGMDFNQAVSAELDNSIYAKSDGSAPAGNSISLLLVKYANTQTAVGYQDSGISILQGLGLPNSQPYKDGLICQDGSTNNSCILVGASERYTNHAVGSQVLKFASKMANGTPMTATIMADSQQNLRIGGAANVMIDGTSQPALGINNTTTGVAWYAIGNASGNLQFYNGSVSPLVIGPGNVLLGKPATLPSYTVSTLPACGSAAPAYSIAAVTDATAPTFLGTLTGGGSVKTPVFCNGTAWVAG